MFKGRWKHLIVFRIGAFLNYMIYVISIWWAGGIVESMWSLSLVTSVKFVLGTLYVRGKQGMDRFGGGLRWEKAKARPGLKTYLHVAVQQNETPSKQTVVSCTLDYSSCDTNQSMRSAHFRIVPDSEWLKINYVTIYRLLNKEVWHQSLAKAIEQSMCLKCRL